MRSYLLALAAACSMVPAAGWAQGGTDMVSAADPDGMAAVLEAAGYSVQTDVDSYGDPLLIVDYSGYEGQIVFYGCDETTNDGCDSVQLTVGLDRDEAMSLQAVNELVANERFVSISLDEEGDPWITWDVVTLGGIPTPVFLNAMEQFTAQVELVADKVFGE